MTLHFFLIQYEIRHDRRSRNTHNPSPSSSLTISRSHNLGLVLKNKWEDVVSQLQARRVLKIGIGLPAIAPTNPKYEKVMSMLLSACEDHDCYFIAQTPRDKPGLLEYSNNSIDDNKILCFAEGVEAWFEFMRHLDFVVSTRIHGGMAGIVNGVPTVIIPTDLRILELVDAMKLPHVTFGKALENNFTSLLDIMDASTKNFAAFESNRRNRLEVYKGILESVGLQMHPELVEIIRSGHSSDAN